MPWEPGTLTSNHDYFTRRAPVSQSNLVKLTELQKYNYNNNKKTWQNRHTNLQLPPPKNNQIIVIIIIIIIIIIVIDNNNDTF